MMQKHILFTLTLISAIFIAQHVYGQDINDLYNQQNDTLFKDEQELDDVVVVGYGTTEKEDLAGSATSLSSDEFNNPGNLVGPESVLSGKVAGLSVSASSGEPGANFRIRLRGEASLNASNDPLIVVDGVPIGVDTRGRNGLNLINPSDIASISVLKDASAASIYGARGANGVIIITTKKGSSSKLSISVNSDYTISTLTRTFAVLDAKTFRQAVGFFDPDKLDLLGTENTNWQDAIFSNNTQSYRTFVAISGGGKYSTTRFSLGYERVEGIMAPASNERITNNINQSFKLLDNDLKFNISLKNAYVKDVYTDNGAIGAALSFDPTQPIYLPESDATGGFFEYTSVAPARSPANPVGTLKLNERSGIELRSIGNVQGSYKLPFLQKSLSINVNLGYEYNVGKIQNFIPSFARSQQATQGTVTFNDVTSNSVLLESFLEWKKYITSLSSSFTVVGGYSYQRFNTEFFNSNNTVLSTNVYGVNNINVAEVQVADVFNEGYTLASFYGRVQYELLDRYLLTLTFRTDGSSRFGLDNQFGYFPAIAGGWKISEENFFKSSSLSKVIDFLKVRASWGIIGNQGIGNYLYLPTFTPSNQMAQVQFGDNFLGTSRPSGVDPNIQWEEGVITDIGLDFSLLKGKISGTIDYYDKKTEKLLFNAQTPLPFLATQTLTNIGSVSNRGIELTLNVTALSTSDFNLSFAFNGAYNKNEILILNGNTDPDFIGVETGNISGGIGNNIQILRVGQPAYSFFVYKHKMEDGKPIYGDVNLDGNTNETDLYEDINGDGIVNINDRVPFESPNPKFILGLTTSFSYKNIDLNIVMKSFIGNYVYNNLNALLTDASRITGSDVPQNVSEDIIEYRFETPELFSSVFVENASFLKFENITLGYNFDFSNLKNPLRLRVYVNAQNPIIITDYSGYDPEVVGGIDNNVYPRTRNFSVGLNLNF